jgi:anti-anti-sigma factor
LVFQPYQHIRICRTEKANFSPLVKTGIMIDIKIETEQSITCISPQGRLDTINSGDFDKAMKSIYENEKYLIVDFSHCDYLSSTGIRILLSAYKKLKAKGGALYIASISPEVFQVIEMVGLHQFFRFFNDCQKAIEEIKQLKNKNCNCHQFVSDEYQFQFTTYEQQKQSALTWMNEGITGYNELGISIGIGSSAESLDENAISGLFFTTGNCAGFIPDNPAIAPDFRIAQTPSQAGIVVKQALSFGQCETGLAQLIQPEPIPMQRLIDQLTKLKSQMYLHREELTGVIVANFNTTAPTLSIGLIMNREKISKLKELGFETLSKQIPSDPEINFFLGAQFELEAIKAASDSSSLNSFMEANLSIDNILKVQSINPSEHLVDAHSWLFFAQGFEDATPHRIQIDAPSEGFTEAYKPFLVRRLYSDSIRVVLKPLHGGFSAQTFQVKSFDNKGRKLRPTVLKIADRTMITRESERCKQYALPYILNNSAMILGTQFFGDHGALCYNFVGIGGEETQLKWLTYYFENWSIEQLEPLFDKTFMQILKPWYGQAVSKSIYPFIEHDPTLSFFPQLYTTAIDILAIDTDQEFITIEETSLKILNPYRFLKHEYKKRSETSIDYYTAICHGDLNMQNILLDQKMNVYLIDFSETRPRSVVTDFARLEAIFMIEFAPLENEDDMTAMIEFVTRFYQSDKLDQFPENTYHGKHAKTINKNVALSLKMRTYALMCAKEKTDIVPYYLALLEWTLPIVCFRISLFRKRLSAIISGLICEKINELLPMK